MHELSIVMSIIEIAEKQAKENNASVVEEIEIDIGELSTVEMDSFNFAWQQAVKGTMLENAARKINRINGLAACSPTRPSTIFTTPWSAETKVSSTQPW